MNSFKEYLKEQPRRFDPRDRVVQTRKVGGEKLVDFDDPAYNHSFNKALRDSEKWPPKPEADTIAKKIRWAVSDGKKAEHLADS